MSEWLPIETAPKDGIVILLYCPNGLSDRPAYQMEKFKLTFGSFTAGERSHEQWQSIESMLEYHDYGGMTGMSTWSEQLKCNPTHWMPLPKLPEHDPSTDQREDGSAQEG